MEVRLSGSLQLRTGRQDEEGKEARKGRVQGRFRYGSRWTFEHIRRGTHEPDHQELHGQVEEDHPELLQGYRGSEAIMRSFQSDVQLLQTAHGFGDGIGQGHTRNESGSDR